MGSRISYFSANSALESANTFAKSLLHSPRLSGEPTFIRSQHDHYHWGSPGWGWGYPQPVYYRPSHSEKPSEKRDHSWVAIPAAAIALGTIFFLGQNYAELASANRAISKLKQRTIEVREELAERGAPPILKNSIELVFRKQMELLNQIRRDALTGLFLKTILVTSVIAAGVGALATGNVLFASSFIPLLPAGCVSTFITTAAMLYRAGVQSGNGVIQEEARELQMAVAQSSEILHSI